MAPSTRGDGRVDVADVIRILRACVGLERLQWTGREVVVVLDGPAALAAFDVVVSGLPVSVDAADFECEACEGDGLASLDEGHGRLAVTCELVAPRPAGEVAIRLTVRSPWPVDPSALVVQVEGVGADLAPVPLHATLR